MITIIVIIMGVSLLFYVLFGGADFGGGIIEIFAKERGRKIISKAIAPVWEANHVWLILVVVILFVGFPRVYSTLMHVLHIPVMITLLGIISRGTAFTFRHYDIQEDRPVRIYTAFFKFSSLLTSLFLGVTLGAVILGRITTDLSEGFYQVYVHPWLNVFSFSLGIFIICLFAYLSAVYLIGEAEDEITGNLFMKYAKTLMIVVVAAGALVFIAAEIDNLHLLNRFLESTISTLCVVFATLLIPLLLRSMNKKNNLWTRIITGAQTASILVGWFAVQYPVLVSIKGGHSLTVANAQAPSSTITHMLIALVVGVAIIIPSLLFLLRVFKFEDMKKL